MVAALAWTVGAAPFIALAVAGRRHWQAVLAGVVTLIALAVVVEMFARPVAFCF